MWVLVAGWAGLTVGVLVGWWAGRRRQEGDAYRAHLRRWRKAQAQAHRALGSTPPYVGNVQIRGTARDRTSN